MAHMIAVLDKGMTAQDRCDRCGAQAYVEVALANDAGTLLFCAHDYAKVESKIAETDALVADHRPYLQSLETTPA